MPIANIDVVGAYRQTFTSGATTGVGAGGILFSMQWASSALAFRLRALEVEAFVTTGFTGAQELGFDAWIGRAYTVAPTAGTQIVLGANDAKKRTSYGTSKLAAAGDLRIANASAITAGTVNLDANPFAKDSIQAAAATAGVKYGPQRFDFSLIEPFGEILANQEGFVIKCTVALGAAGVVVWKFTPEWEEVILNN